MKRAVLSAIALGLISACGGGGGSSTPSSPNPTPPSSPAPPPAQRPSATPVMDATNFAIYADSQLAVGQSAGLAIAAKNNLRLSEVQWTQTAGPDTAPLAAHTQVIGFDASESGDYQYNVTATLSNGEQVDADVAFTVLQSDAPTANVRLDHVASERSKVSLRADGQSDKIVSNVLWEQVSGPDVDDLQIQGNFLFFNAPDVTRDSVVEFSATVSYSDGTEASDLSRVVIRDVNINANGYFPSASIANRIVTTDMFAYRADSPYADGLEQCIYNNQVSSSCRFSQLPLIGTVTPDPDIDDIMDRVLVSHAWMGERFEQYLRNSVASQDMVKLLRATTGVVISYDVRPSFYWSATGAIYLDANNFWVTAEERDTLNDQPDFRSDFGNDLNFVIPWRYVKDNDYYFRSSNFPRSARVSKEFSDLEASITWLMYHELGHANDFLPPTSWAGMDESSSPLAYVNQNRPSSDRFSDQFGLQSAPLRSLAQVSFAGVEASSTQRGYTPADVTSFFEPELSPAYYSFLNVREDYATLFERFMMLYRMGVSADVAVTDVRETNYLVNWGQRDRISDPRLLPRLRSVINDILPELDVDTIHATFPEPMLMTPGRDWFDNIALGVSGKSLSTQPKTRVFEPVQQGYPGISLPRPKQ